jgi:myosin heavy subunit
MAEKILAIDARMGKRGRRKTMEFAGSMVQSEIDAYKEEMKMTSSELSQYRSETKEYMETAQQVASDGIAVVAEAKEAITKAQTAADNAATAAEKASASITDAKQAATDAKSAKSEAESAKTAAENASTKAETAAEEAAKSAEMAAGAVTGVATWNSRSGNVMPQSGDYSYDMITGTPTNATTTTDGIMSSTDKAKLDGLSKVTVDTEIKTSSNPVANSAVKSVTDALQTAIDTLNGSGAGSVAKAVSDAIAKVVADAPSSFDTLKEISDWITTHSEDAAAMNSQIETNKADIATNATAISALLTPVRLGIKTLAAGETSLSWTSDAIADTCVIDVYCSINGVAPTAQEQSGTTYTVTFDAQSDDMQVDVVVIP